MKKWSGWFFALFVGFLFLEILLGFPVSLNSRTDEEAPPLQQDLSQISGAEQKMQGVHLVESKSGSRDWELFAEAAEGYQGKGTWELKNVKVLFYSGDIIQFTVTGETGSIDTKTKDMDIAGNVETISSNGYRFQAPAVKYLAQARLLRSSERVKMTGPPDAKGRSMILTGENMETQVDKSIMNIKEDVQASREFGDNDKKFLIKSQGAEFSGKSYSARFYGQVAIELDSMKMEGPEANFQYDKGKDFLQSILVKGGVKVSDIDKYATSEQVRFEPNENKFVLNGHPRVVQNNDEIQGDQIVFIEGGKKVKVENIRARMDK
jgi:LPS export ABC transporter protein LptC/lipopolysaccharide transport protein LptA